MTDLATSNPSSSLGGDMSEDMLRCVAVAGCPEPETTAGHCPDDAHEDKACRSSTCRRKAELRCPPRLLAPRAPTMTGAPAGRQAHPPLQAALATREVMVATLETL